MQTITALYDAGVTMPEHEDGGARISVILRGSLYEESRHGTVGAHAGSLVIKGGAARHSTHIRQEGRLFSVVLEPDMVPERAWYWRGDSSACRLVCQLFLADQNKDQAALQNTVCEIMALDSPRENKPVPSWLQAVKTQLDEDDDALSVKQLAHQQGCHPVHLARRFRGFFGVSVSEYQHWRRIQRAMALAGRFTGIADLALEAGYYDQSHMTRYFKRLLGTTPKKWFHALGNTTATSNKVSHVGRPRSARPLSYISPA